MPDLQESYDFVIVGMKSQPLCRRLQDTEYLHWQAEEQQDVS